LGRIDRLVAEGFDLGGLEKTFGFLLLGAWRDASRVFTEHFTGSGMTPLGFSILLLIDRNPGCAPGGLSEIMGITPNNMARLIEDMVKRGAVDRKVSEKDRRIRVLFLTAQGQTLLDDLKARHRAYEDHFNAKIGQVQLDELCRILRNFD